MKPKFIGVLYFEGRILMFEEWGDVYEFHPGLMEWTLLARSPWPGPQTHSDAALLENRRQLEELTK